MENTNSLRKFYKIDENFFKSWSSEMAYIFGFTCADGNIHGKSLSWDLSNNSESNLTILKKFNLVMNSNYPINMLKGSYRLRISNKHILEGIKKLGIFPNKSKTIKYPSVPEKYSSHFLRGFLDGDGWIAMRYRNNLGEVTVGFCSGSINFMKGILVLLKKRLDNPNIRLRKRSKFTKKGKIAEWYQLDLYAKDAKNILEFIYSNLTSNDLFLERKYSKFIEARKIFENSELRKIYGKKGFLVSKNLHFDLIENIKELLLEGLLPREVAAKLNISLATLYRWMDKHNIRKFTKRGSIEWSQRIIKSRKLIKK